MEEETQGKKMYVVVKGYGKDTFDSNASSINFETLKTNKRMVRKAAQCLKQMWEQLSCKVPKIANPDYVSTPGGVNLKVKQPFVGSEQQQFAEVIVTVVDYKGKSRMVRALLNTGCSMSIILKKFTKQKQQNKLNQNKSSIPDTQWRV